MSILARNDTKASWLPKKESDGFGALGYNSVIGRFARVNLHFLSNNQK